MRPPTASERTCEPRWNFPKREEEEEEKERGRDFEASFLLLQRERGEEGENEKSPLSLSKFTSCGRDGRGFPTRSEEVET